MQPPKKVVAYVHSTSPMMHRGMRSTIADSSTARALEGAFLVNVDTTWSVHLTLAPDTDRDGRYGNSSGAAWQEHATRPEHEVWRQVATLAVLCPMLPDGHSSRRRRRLWPSAGACRDRRH